MAKVVDVPLTKTFGKCYAMESKQIPLIGKIKDSHVDLVELPKKRLQLTILVTYILANYGMLLSRSFCKELGGELKLD